MIAALFLWTAALATASPAEGSPTVLYGGAAASAEQVKAADRTTGRDVEARWFLESIAPAVPGVYLLGGATFAPCTSEPVPVDRVRALAADGLALLDDILPDDAVAPYAEGAALLPCLVEPLPPEELARLHFGRAIATLTQKAGDRTANKAVGLSAFAAATAAEPELQWDEAYSSYPRSVFFEGKVQLLKAPRARVWLVDDGHTRLWIEGRELTASREGVNLLAGSHLVHLARDGQTWSGELDLAPGAEVVIGEPAALWLALTSRDGVERGLAARRGLTSAVGGPAVLVRGDAFAALEPDGSLQPWSDEGAYRARLILGLGGRWLYLRRDVQVPRLDTPMPASRWAMPPLTVALQFHPVFSVHAEGSFAFTGPFESAGEKHWRLMGGTRLGVKAEVPEGRLRPGLVLDAVGLLPGTMTVAGEARPIVLIGPMAAGALALRLTDLVFLELDAGAGWIGSPSARFGLEAQLRLPPARRRLELGP